MKVEIQSQFIKPNVDVKQGDVAKIVSEGELVPSPQDAKKKIWNFKLELMSGTVKTASFNNGSLRNLIKAWGDDSKNWVGKQVTVDVVKVQAFGEVRDSMVWKPVDAKPEIPQEI